ncbi:MAG: hypothetical protein M1831_002527 [Alyxoria varia]|nr:MAG: hypothetical protein M1831_002527 [Alyxoria varia]
MSQPISSQEMLAYTVKQLLSDPKYTDLTFKCQGQEIKAHRAIVCKRSRVLDAACGGEFKEAHTRCIEVEEVDLPTFKRVLCFLYSDGYDDGYIPGTNGESDPVNEGNGSAEEAHSGNETAQADLIDTGSEDQPETDPQKQKSSSVNDALEIHAKVYKAADYYEILPLMTLAAQRFEDVFNAFEECDTKDFARVVDTVYNSLPEHATIIRGTTRNIVYTHSAALFGDKAFMDYLSRSPELVCELVPYVLRRQNRNMEELQLRLNLMGTDAASERNRASYAEGIARVQRKQIHTRFLLATKANQPAPRKMSQVTGRLASDLKQLMLDPNFSDLTLKCEGQEFSAHRLIVCACSPVFKAECSGQFKAITRCIEVTIADVPTLKRMVCFMYADDYDDGAPAKAIDEVCQINEIPEHVEAEDGMRDSSDYDNVRSSNKDSVAGSDASDDSGSQRNSLRDDPNEALKNNIRVFIAADYYQIQALMDLALVKFDEALKESTSEGFEEVVVMAYTEAPIQAKRLRASVRGYVLEHLTTTLQNNEAFLDTVRHLPEFMGEIIPQIIGVGVSNVERAKRSMEEGRAGREDMRLQLDDANRSTEIQRGRAERAEGNAEEAETMARMQRKKVEQAGSKELGAHANLNGSTTKIGAQLMLDPPEAQTGRIAVNIADSETLKRMISSMCSDGNGDGSEEGSRGVADSASRSESIPDIEWPEWFRSVLTIL